MRDANMSISSKQHSCGEVTRSYTKMWMLGSLLALSVCDPGWKLSFLHTLTLIRISFLIHQLSVLWLFRVDKMTTRSLTNFVWTVKFNAVTIFRVVYSGHPNNASERQMGDFVNTGSLSLNRVLKRIIFNCFIFRYPTNLLYDGLQ